MAVAVGSARSAEDQVLYEVIGVDQDTAQGRARSAALAGGEFPFKTMDNSLLQALSECHRQGNLTATTDYEAFASADVVVVDVPLDISFQEDKPQLRMESLISAFRTVSQQVPRAALILVETTVPPGVCERVLLPILEEDLAARGMEPHSVRLAHSYERVMPGKQYLDSITHFWRVYAGADATAADACEAFLSSIIDIEKFPLTRLASMTASETAKLMENTYRAANIAFVDEWTKYAESVGIDLYEVIDAIRVRPTHSNIRSPGLGVGGYCLTKDPAFAPASARELFDRADLDFPFSDLTLKVNQAMPIHCAQRLQALLGGACKDKNILILGVSYRQDVDDTRISPVEILVRTLTQAGAVIKAFDPFVTYWSEMECHLLDQMPEPFSFDAVVFSTPHQEFIELDVFSWLGEARPVVLDAVNVIAKPQREQCRAAGIKIESIGRGDGL
jgi:UDP-N-acetyl-D-glucosamine dehydrogenase